MANVVSIVERFQQPTASHDVDGYVFTREFRVLFDAADHMNPVACLSASVSGGASIPAIGEFLGFGGLVVNKRTSRCLDPQSRLAWQVLVEYGSGFHLDVKKNAKPQPKTQVYPWSKTPLYTYDFEKSSKVLEKDFSSTPKDVLNSASDPFDPPIMTAAYNKKIVCSRATLTYSSTLAGDLIGRVNSDPVTIDGNSYAANMLVLLRWSGSEQTYSDTDTGEETTCFQESIELLASLDSGGHTLQVLDCGYNQLDGSGKKRIHGTDGKPTPTPALLSAGMPLAIGSPGVYLAFKPHPAAGFSPLGLS